MPSPLKIAIIPARGGSKRIPRKNIKDFHGKPIIAYSIEAALQSGLFDEVMVSTDDAKIAEIAKHFGAKVPTLRSEKNSDDIATTSDVLLEVIKHYEGAGVQLETLCCIYPTAPLIDATILTDAYAHFDSEAFDVLMACVRFSFPIQRGFRLQKDQSVELLYPELIKERSQDLPTTYHDAGAFYFFKNASFKKTGNLWSGRVGAFELPESRVQDIDTEEDWKIAELKYQMIP